MNDAFATPVIWRRLIYMLTPQLDIYESVKKIAHGKRILEIGFGTGLGVLQYHAHAEYVDAVEIDPSAFNFARKTLPLRNVRWIVDDFSNPSRTYRGYDLVVMVEVLEHVVHQGPMLLHFYDAMTPGGYGIITVPNANRYRRRQESLNVREYNPYSIREMLEKTFTGVTLLDTNLMQSEDLETKESPLVIGVFRGR